MFTKTPVYSVEIVRYTLLLRYPSIQSYWMLLEHFPLPSLSLMHKISSDTIHARYILSNVHRPWEIRVNFPMMCVYYLTIFTYKNVKSILLVIWWPVTMKANYTKDWFALWYGSWKIIFHTWLSHLQKLKQTLTGSRRTCRLSQNLAPVWFHC